jgi:DNA-binding NarL/FixJ family response regulator
MIAGGAFGPGGGRGIVLVVDDSPETLALLIDALEEAGLTALVARDGHSALALLDRVEPDVILLDAMMPGIDGFETCRRIKRRTDMATTPVVFMTGLSDRAHVAQALQAGGVDYVSKPVAPDELIARIAVHVVNARMIADARRAIDESGRGVAAFDASGACAWATPRARTLLDEVARIDGASALLAAWICATVAEAVSQTADLALGGLHGPAIRVSAIGRAASGDLLARIRASAGGSPTEVLSRSFGVSLREAEVLGWLSRGKSNRDIAEILGLSPRTVTKHVEQLFSKLGVENRTSAAGMALKVLE